MRNSVSAFFLCFFLVTTSASAIRFPWEKREVTDQQALLAATILSGILLVKDRYFGAASVMVFANPWSIRFGIRLFKELQIMIERRARGL